MVPDPTHRTRWTTPHENLAICGGICVAWTLLDYVGLLGGGRPGVEPGTNGFAVPARFRAERTISSPSALAGGVRDALACHQGRCSPQVVSAPSGGVPPARLRIAAGQPVARPRCGSPEFFPFSSAHSCAASPFDESSALTIEL